MSSSHQERIADVKREAQELVNYILGRETYQCIEHIPTTDEHDGNIKIEICDESMLEGNGETANGEILGHQDYAPLNTCSNSMHIDHGQAGGNGFMCLTLQRSLSTLIEQNKALIADNKMIRNTLTNVLEQNSLLLEENLKLKSSMEMQNRLLQDHQKKMDDFQQNIAEDNRKSRDTNFKLFTHFTEEFIQLRNKVEDLLNGPRFVPSAWFVPVLSTPEEILKFDEQIKEDENIKCQLVSVMIPKSQGIFNISIITLPLK